MTIPAPTLLGEKVELVIGRGGSHWYRVGLSDVLYPSITTVIESVLAKPALVPWAKKVALESMRKELLGLSSPCDIQPKDWASWIDSAIERAKKKPKEIAEGAANIGTRAHLAIDEMLKGLRPMDTDGLDDDIKPSVSSFISWWKECDLEILRSEIRLASHKLKVGGSMDCLARKKKHKSLVALDWKTNNAIYGSMIYQIGGYTVCAEEMLDTKVEEGWIVRFPKELDMQVPFEAFRLDRNLLQMARTGFKELRSIYELNKIFGEAVSR